MTDINNLLDAHNIFPPHYGPGRQYLTCPRCSAGRKPHHQKLKCLSLMIESDQKAYWKCHHCGWVGPERRHPTGDGRSYYDYGSHTKVRNPKGSAVPFQWIGGAPENGALYYLDDALDCATMTACPILIAEGEKDVETLWKYGFVAVCAAHGASQWTPGHAQHLKGRDVVVLNDNDRPGYEFAAKVVASLRSVAKTVRRLDLKPHWPGVMPEGADVSDFLALAPGQDEMLKLLIDEAPLVNGHDPLAVKAPPAAHLPKTNWLEDCLTSGKEKKPISNQYNAVLGVRYDPELNGKLRLNRFANKTLNMTTGREITDVDVTDIQAYLQRCGLVTLSNDATHKAVEVVAAENSFHPVVDYLNSLKWDGTPRVDGWLSHYAGCVRTPYTVSVGRMFLIQMIARVIEPGCKADYMIVLEGEQGERKSAMLRILGQPWFTDHLPDIGTKDAQLHLRGHCLIEVAEMNAFSRAASTELKSFLSRQEDRYRPPYGRCEIEQPRQCVFAGTTNDETYLKDDTGNRRFWPVLCTKIDLDALCRDRDQLLAEAYHLKTEGEHWWPDHDFEVEHIKPEQDKRYDTDPWTEKVADYVAAYSATPIKVLDIATNHLGIPTGQVHSGIQKRIAAILKRLGFERQHTRTGKVFVRKPTWGEGCDPL